MSDSITQFDPVETARRKDEAIELFTYSQNYWKTKMEPEFERRQKVFLRQFSTSAQNNQNSTYANWPLKSKLFIPKVFANVKIALSRALGEMVGKDIVSVTPEGDTPLENCAKVEFLLLKQFKEFKPLDTLSDIFTDTMVLGYCPAKLIWEKENNRPMLLALDAWDFYFDPQCRGDLTKSEWVIQRNIKTVSQLEKMIEQGIYQADIKDLENLSTNAAIRRNEIFDPSKDSRNSGSKRLRNVEILECWFGDEIITLAGRSLVLRRAKNPLGFYPFVLSYLGRRPHDILAEGIVGPAVDLQMELNFERNARLQLTIQQLAPQAVVSGDEWDEEEFVWDPNGIIHKNNPNDTIEWLTPPDKAGSSLTEENIIDQNIDEVTQINDIMRGQSERPSESATGVLSRSENSNLNIGYNSLCAGEFLRQVAEMMIDLNRIYLSPVDYFDPKTQKMTKISLTDIMGKEKYNFNPSIKTTPLKELKKKQITELYDKLKDNPAVDQRALTEELLTVLEVENRDKILPEQKQAEIPGGGGGMGQSPTSTNEQPVNPLPENLTAMMPQFTGNMMGNAIQGGGFNG